MPVNVQANATINNLWTTFKSIAITSKSLLIQYDDDGVVYTIFAFDTDNIAYICTIWKGTVPDPVIAGGYSQSQNNTDKTDFETNYKPTANSKLGNAAAQFGTWSVNDVQTSESTAAWTSSTTINTALALTCTNYSTVTITLAQGSTITGGVVTFEVSDTIAGTNWYPMSVISSAGATVPASTYTLQQSTNASFQTNVAGYVQFRVRLSTVISGTGTVNVGLAAIASAAEWQQATYITDASHGPAAVKAASTAAAAADPALVVSVSPNSPVTISGSSQVVTVAPAGETVFGYVATSAKTTVPIRATTYTQISGAPVQVSVKSASTSDTSAGTGARTITITYLTTGLVRKTETITMNGTTAVNSVGSDYAFIEKVIVSTAGSGRTNAGIITVFSGTGGTGTALCSMAASDGRTNLCHHYVTTGKSCYINQVTIASNGGTNGLIQFYLTSNAENDILVPITPGFRTSQQEASFVITFNPFIKVPDTSITNGNLIVAYVTPDATTSTNWYVSFTYYEA